MAEKQRGNNRITGILFTCMFLVIGVLASAGYGLYIQDKTDRLLMKTIFVFILILSMSVFYSAQLIDDKLQEYNINHLLRYELALLCCFVIIYSCIFLPVGGWPVLFIPLLITFFSNMQNGLFTGAMLILIPTVLTDSGIVVFAMYYIAAAFTVMLFRNVEDGFHIGGPLITCLITLFVLEVAGTILPENLHPNFEVFVIPLVNVFISALLISATIKIFLSRVFYRHADVYLTINDTENAPISKLREENKEEYMLCVHTAYFAERIASALDMNKDVIKGCSYYYRFDANLETIMEEQNFPDELRNVLLEYKNRANGITSKECAVVMITHTVITSIQFLIGKKDEHTIDYDKVIDTIFNRFIDGPILHRCNITMEELYVMRGIFKEEKLYYDFLR